MRKSYLCRGKTMAAKSTRDGSDGEVTAVRLWVKPSIETMFTQSMSFTHSAVRFQADVDPPLEMERNGVKVNTNAGTALFVGLKARDT